MLKQTLCFGCAHIHDFNNKGRFLICPKCGFRIGRGRQNKLIDYSYDAVRYGYNYRITYEGEHDGCGDEARYSLAPPEEALIFVAAAIASGIIGNAAYDVVKSVINKIKSSIQDSKNYRNFEQTIFVLENEGEIERFTTYMRDFYNGFEGVNKKVVVAIMEEVVADKLTGTAKRVLERGIDPTDPTYIKRSLKKTMVSLKKPHVPVPCDFKNVWVTLEGAEQISTCSESNEADAPDQEPVG